MAAENLQLIQKNTNFLSDKTIFLSVLKQWANSPLLNSALRSEIELILESPIHSLNPSAAFSSLPLLTKSDLLSPLLQLPKLNGENSFSRKLMTGGGTNVSELLTARPIEQDNESSQLEHCLRLVHRAWKLDLTKTFFINAYPHGIALPLNFWGIDVFARPELVYKTLENFGHQFESIILVCQPLLLKLLVDNKILEKHKTKIRLILGGSWYPRSLLQYVAAKMEYGIEDVVKSCISMYGLSEVGLGIGIEMPEDIQERQNRDASDPLSLAQTFVGSSKFYHYENIQNELVITRTSPSSSIPVVRYRTGDKIISIENPDSDLKFSLCGRKKWEDDLVRKKFMALFNNIYCDVHLASCLTGRVQLAKDKSLHWESRFNNLMSTEEVQRRIKALDTELTHHLHTPKSILHFESESKSFHIDTDLIRKSEI